MAYYKMKGTSQKKRRGLIDLVKNFQNDEQLKGKVASSMGQRKYSQGGLKATGQLYRARS